MTSREAVSAMLVPVGAIEAKREWRISCSENGYYYSLNNNNIGVTDMSSNNG
jgi:hypothetical protein